MVYLRGALAVGLTVDCPVAAHGIATNATSEDEGTVVPLNLSFWLNFGSCAALPSHHVSKCVYNTHYFSYDCFGLEAP